ncbi:external NADH-ubiquinone oxidoreductase 1 [Syncephalis fuscata]|nr:external NADH-ubiquinone oxidoreductase 1 [Syncephalis fuscata]
MLTVPLHFNNKKIDRFVFSNTIFNHDDDGIDLLIGSVTPGLSFSFPTKVAVVATATATATAVVAVATVTAVTVLLRLLLITLIIMFRSLLARGHRGTGVSASRTSLSLGATSVTRRWATTQTPPVKPKWRKMRILALTTYGAICAGTGYAGMKIYQERYPGDQPAPGEDKKTLVILGTGWGATSLLKGINTENYNVIVVSPKNYFLFTPLLPSCTVGTVDHRSVIHLVNCLLANRQPIRYITRHKKAAVKVLEAECSHIDPVNRTITVEDNSEIRGNVTSTTIPFDYLVVAVGAENQTFGIPGVTEHACFLKEIWDAKKIRGRLMDCIETAAFAGQSEEEIQRLLHMVVVGGGPTGVEYAAELHDFIVEDLAVWYPDIAGKVKITLVEADDRNKALPNVLPAFSKQLIEYTESTFKENKINILTKTKVKGVEQKHITVEDAAGKSVDIPYGLLVWATGNTSRPVVRNLIAALPKEQNQRRGLVVDQHMQVMGSENIFAIGDASATRYAPTAQVASQQGAYLAAVFNKLAKKEDEGVKATDLRPFHYSHFGSLAYIGADKAIADLSVMNGNVSVGGVATYLFWRSVYLSNLFSIRNRSLVASDWIKRTLFGRDIGRD